MLCHGIHAEHALMLIFGLLGVILGAVSLFHAAFRLKGSILHASLALACCVAVLVCGLHLWTGTVTALEDLGQVVTMSDVAIFYLPGLVLAVLGLIVRASRGTDRGPA